MKEKEESVSLRYKESGSDKDYNASLEKKGSGWVVNFSYGRHGSTMNVGTKTPSPVPYGQALDAYQKLVRSKQAKGYTIDPDGKVFKGAIEESRDTNVRPQLLNMIEEEEVEKYLTDDNWCAQEKFDGCLSFDSLISTEDGEISIQDIVDKKMSCKVLTYNESTKKTELKSIVNHMVSPSDENTQWYEVLLENEEVLRITGNHRVYLPELKCWRRIDELIEGDFLMSLK